MKVKALTRQIMFTEVDALMARDSGKFGTHRDFVEWLFKKQHKVVIENHSLLKYEYLTVKNRAIVKVTGQMGQGLLAK